MSLYRRMLFLLLVATLATGSSGTSLAAAGSARSGPQPALTHLGDGLVVEWRTPAPAFATQPDGGVMVTLPGYEQVRSPGAPLVPVASILVALPPGAQPSLEILHLEEHQLTLPAALALAPRPQGVLRSPDGQVIGGAFTPVDEAMPFEPAPVTLEPLGLARGVQLARLVFYPARPSEAGLQWTASVRAVLHFNTPALPGPGLPAPAADLLLPVLRSAVANPQHVQARLSLPAAFPLQSKTVYDAGTTLAVEVEHHGLVAISPEALATSGWDTAGMNPHFLSLSRGGIEIPLEWEGDEDALFEPGERLLFYAEPRFSRWTRADVFFLSYAPVPGLRIESRSGTPGGLPSGLAWVEVIAEQNTIYTPDCFCGPLPAGRDGDRWVWQSMQRPGKESASFEVALSGIDTSQPASLELDLIGFTDVEAAPDHRVQVAFNGASLGQIEWDGKQAANFTLTIPASELLEGSNTLELSLPGLDGVAVDGVWLDTFRVRYAHKGGSSLGNAALVTGQGLPHAYTIRLSGEQGLRVYDVTEPERPLRLTGVEATPNGLVSLGDPAEAGPHRYWLGLDSAAREPAALRQLVPIPTEAGFAGADYLVITTAAFAPALQDLVTLRSSQGLVTQVVEVQAIYDGFGDGRPEPEAIRSYLAHAYATWERPPTYVLLVGDGTIDPKKYVASSSTTFIPPFLADVDPWAGETAADNRYVMLDGEDNLPEMLVGRLPANSLLEAQVMVDKVVQAETNPPAGVWNSRAVFVADNPDGGGDFPAFAEKFVTQFFSSWSAPERLYYTSLDAPAAPIQDALHENWNAGAGLIVFSGHASVHQWAAEQFIHLNDVPGLSNAGRLPVVLEMTCFTGSFHLPGFPSLDEALLRHPDGGAAAVWGPTGLGLSTGHTYLLEGFLQTALEGNTTLGAAALSGKLNLAAHNPASMDLVDTFTLLGDPAAAFYFTPSAPALYLPLVTK